MSEQLSLLGESVPTRPRLPGSEIQVRMTSRSHICVVCRKDVPRGERAEVWPDGAAHIACGIAERWRP